LCHGPTPTGLYPLSLHDALPICRAPEGHVVAEDDVIEIDARQASIRVAGDADMGATAIGFTEQRPFNHEHSIHPDVVLSWIDDADRKSTRLNSSHVKISYAVFCL